MLQALTSLSADDPTGGALSNLPADPARAWAVIIIIGLMTVAPIIKANFDGKKTKSSEPKIPTTSVVIGGSVTPHIDASQQLLATVVGNIEERARQAEAKYDELERRHVKLVADVARSELKVEMLEDRVHELEAENNVLQGQLRGRP